MALTVRAQAVDRDLPGESWCRDSWLGSVSRTDGQDETFWQLETDRHAPTCHGYDTIGFFCFHCGINFPYVPAGARRKSARGFGTAEPISVAVPAEMLQVLVSESCDGPDHPVRDGDALMAGEQQRAATVSNVNAAREDVNGRDHGVRRPRCFGDEYGTARRCSRTRKVELDPFLGVHAPPGHGEGHGAAGEMETGEASLIGDGQRGKLPHRYHRLPSQQEARRGSFARADSVAVEDGVLEREGAHLVGRAAAHRDVPAHAGDGTQAPRGLRGGVTRKEDGSGREEP